MKEKFSIQESSWDCFGPEFKTGLKMEQGMVLTYSVEIVKQPTKGQGIGTELTIKSVDYELGHAREDADGYYPIVIRDVKLSSNNGGVIRVIEQAHFPHVYIENQHIKKMIEQFDYSIHDELYKVSNVFKKIFVRVMDALE